MARKTVLLADPMLAAGQSLVAIDTVLNEKGYIVSGLGDLAFGEKL